ncbi:primosomal protein DnaI, partial [Salmonella enterica subsp. enterica]|nr:primosomal protein DnaI [Salmonella enterica subsp. enterica]
MAVPQTPPRVIGGTPPAVLTGLCGTIKTVALLGCCSILRNIMSSRILTSDVIGID